MGIVQREAFYNSIITYAGMGIGYVNVLLLFPLFFTAEQYGLTRVLLSISFILVQISQFGMSTVLLRHLPYYRDDVHRLAGFLLFTIVIPLAGITVVTVLGILMQERIVALYENQSPLLAQYFMLVIPLTVFITYSEIGDALSRSYKAIVFPTLVKEVITRLLVTAVIMAYHFKIVDFSSFVIGFVGVYGVCALLQFVYNLRFINWSGWIKPLVPKGKDFFEMLTYGGYTLASSAATIVVNNIDIIMLSYLMGLKEVAVYTIAFFIATVIQVPQRTISRITLPLLAEHWKKRAFAEVAILYRKSSVNLLITGGLLFSVIWVNVDDLLSLIPKSEIYQEGKMVILLIALSKLFDMATGINTEIIAISEQYRFNFIAVFSLVILSVITNYIFIPVYGIEGAALATLISVVLYNLMKYVFVFFRLHMQPFGSGILKCLVVAVISLWAGSVIPVEYGPIFNILIRSAFVSGLFLILIYVSKASEDINTIVNRFVLKKDR